MGDARLERQPEVLGEASRSRSSSRVACCAACATKRAWLKPRLARACSLSSEMCARAARLASSAARSHSGSSADSRVAFSRSTNSDVSGSEASTSPLVAGVSAPDGPPSGVGLSGVSLCCCIDAKRVGVTYVLLQAVARSGGVWTTTSSGTLAVLAGAAPPNTAAGGAAGARMQGAHVAPTAATAKHINSSEASCTGSTRVSLRQRSSAASIAARWAGGRGSPKAASAPVPVESARASSSRRMRAVHILRCHSGVRKSARLCVLAVCRCPRRRVVGRRARRLVGLRAPTI